MSRFRAEPCVHHHHAARDGGHEGGHDGAEFGAGHAADVLADGGHGFDAQEDQQGCAESLRAGGLERAAHEPRYGAHDRLDHVEMIQDAGNRRHENNHGKNLERHQCAIRRIPGQVAEDKTRAFKRRIRQNTGQLACPRERDPFQPGGQQHGPDRKLQAQAPKHQTPRRLAPVFGQCPGQEHHYPETTKTD